MGEKKWWKHKVPTYILKTNQVKNNQNKQYFNNQYSNGLKSDSQTYKLNYWEDKLKIPRKPFHTFVFTNRQKNT